MLETSMTIAAAKANVPLDSVDITWQGSAEPDYFVELCCQKKRLPFIGLYGACSTMALSTAPCKLIDGGSRLKYFAVHPVIMRQQRDNTFFQ